MFVLKELVNTILDILYHDCTNYDDSSEEPDADALSTLCVLFNALPPHSLRCAAI